MSARLRRLVPVLVLAAVVVVAAVVCVAELAAAGPLNPVASWTGAAGDQLVATKSQFEGWTAARTVAVVAAVVAVVAAVGTVVVTVVTRRRDRP
ncbi:hypothetical protein BIU97_09890 [Curtobacterium sp. MCBA15_009]|uniref:hypothetical protein n=1 Tax=Curtobacterium sp. MCBA15_009 TaxID=1898737 RepID=UPI0008DEA8B9|nr:hypothetical protein [Curtobacterium sp. MCBA15_009]OII10439.1 hypothetical protein BIU97_09890 [Curtobacterium sp. MCBA15_009]